MRLRMRSRTFRQEKKIRDRRMQHICQNGVRYNSRTSSGNNQNNERYFRHDVQQVRNRRKPSTRKILHTNSKRNSKLPNRAGPYSTGTPRRRRMLAVQLPIPMQRMPQTKKHRRKKSQNKKTMNIYYDCEFLEGTQDKRIFGIKTGRKTPPTIDLISIGMVREDGSEYYAISKDFNLKEAWYRYDSKTEEVHGDMRNVFPEGRRIKVYWIRENVLRPIWIHLVNEHNRKVSRISLTINHKDEKQFTLKSFKRLLLTYGKSNSQIASEVEWFCQIRKTVEGDEYTGLVTEVYHNEEINLYGYYSAYDHVALSWLFGKMINLPNGFPMYTKDLKQYIDEFAKTESDINGIPKKEAMNIIKRMSNYPKQENKHSAIQDARWNQKLHEFLKSI